MKFDISVETLKGIVLAKGTSLGEFVNDFFGYALILADLFGIICFKVKPATLKVISPHGFSIMFI